MPLAEQWGGVVEQHRAQVGVECPQCHFRQFMEVDSDLEGIFSDNVVARKIYDELQAWMVSRCPEHLKVISGMSRN
ncbi:MAG TPA: hypothetical protein VMI31_03945 [Fimbriimonadaceae bacterium]|nr:hypothetical protein [Fimbriimonadaceae bacterium]